MAECDIKEPVLVARGIQVSEMSRFCALLALVNSDL